MANYQLSNFLATPTSQDTRMRIYDKNSKLKYTLDPNVAYFYKKANIVIIKVEDKNDIYLDFSSSTESAQALAKLNEAKRMMTQPGCTPDPNGTTVYSKANLNMTALVTTTDGDLACNTAILDTPKVSSHVRVFVNGVEVNSGDKNSGDCYFSRDGGSTALVVGDERLGDKLYWNGSIANYNLDNIDLIDFIYLIEVNV
jgi:hypothetical protein